MTVRPNFLFIGADRCGSKSLHNMFLQHPDCYVPPIADPYFFDKNYDRGLDWYFKLFADAPASALAIGEFSHDYIHSPEAAERIAQDLPEAKILATLRHPLDRIFSSYASAHSAGVIRVPFEQALDEVPMLIQNSLYVDKLKTYYERFDEERIKILFFDDLAADPASFGKEAFDFLGLRFVEEIDYGRKMSPLSKPRLPLSGYLSKKGANLLRQLGWVEMLGRLKSNKFVRGIFYAPYSSADKPQMAPHVRKRLLTLFTPQVEQLEVMLQRDLSPWKL